MCRLKGMELKYTVLPSECRTGKILGVHGVTGCFQGDCFKGPSNKMPFLPKLVHSVLSRVPMQKMLMSTHLERNQHAGGLAERGL